MQADGQTATAQVVRIGPFTIMSNGKYLSYLPSLKSLAVLTRQPPSQFLSAAGNLQEATERLRAFGRRPGPRRSDRLVRRAPDVVERIEHGQEVGYVIIAVGRDRCRVLACTSSST